MGARVALADAGLTLYVVRRLDEKLARRLSQQVGAEVRLIDYRSYTAGPVTAFTPLYAAAFADGRSAVQRIDSQDTYAASVPVFAPSGEAIALIEVLLPTSAVDAPTRHLVRKLLIASLLLAALAVVAGVFLAERLAGPVRALTGAAARLGAGDFSASIPSGGAAEVGVLAHTMEDMRRNLIELTSTLRRREAEAQAVLVGIVEGVYAVDRSRIIRYLNPQAAKLLGVTAAQAVGRFCGDVLKPRPEGGRRPCEFRCPIIEARGTGSARAVEQLCPSGDAVRTTVITSAAQVEGLQVQVMRDETELEAVRRARDSVLANISHEFRTPLAAQLASIELLLDGLDDDAARGAARAPDLARARHGAPDAAHRQPARERAHRVGAARDPSAERRARGRGGGRRDARRRAAAPAPPAPRGRRCRPSSRCSRATAAPHAGVREPARQRQQVRARGQYGAHRRAGRGWRGAGMGRGRGAGSGHGR